MGLAGPILLTGASGQVGGELLQTLAPLGEIVAPTRRQMDLANCDSIRDTIRAVRPRWIVNPAAYTAVDKAESAPEQAFAINHTAVEVIGEEARNLGAAVLHFSTDYVFSGTGATPYREDDQTGPTSVYGASKLAGEEALAASGAAYLVLRTSWVYGATGSNFLLTILRLARERETLSIVADQHGSPTGSLDLARMTASMMRKTEVAAVEQDRALAEAVMAFGGRYHASGSGETTWFGFAEEAVRQWKAREPRTKLASLVPITTAEYPTPAKRPLNSRLDCAKLTRTFGWTMPHWTQSLREVMARLSESLI